MGEIFRQERSRVPLVFTGERFTTDATGQIEYEHLHRYLLARDMCRGKDVVDIASGEGYGAALLAQVARNVVGIEIDPAIVRHATAAYCRDNLRYMAGDARDIPLPDGSVDIVTSFETLEHFLEHDEFIGEVKRVLRPGGMLVISTPNRDVYSPEGEAANRYHVNELSREEFDSVLRRRFSHVELFMQRTIAGSILASAEPSAREAQRNFVTFERRDDNFLEQSAGLPRAKYFLACASDELLPISLFSSVYLETSELDRVAGAARKELQDLHARLAHQQSLEGRWSNDLNNLNANLDAARQELAERDAALLASRAGERTLRDEILAAINRLAEAEHTAVDYAVVLSDLCTREQELHTEFLLKTEQLVVSQAEVARQRDFISRLQDNEDQLDADVARMTAHMNVVQSQMAERDELLSELRAREQRLREDIERSERELAAARAEAARNEAARSESRMSEQRLREEILAAIQQVDRSQSELIRRDTALFAVQESEGQLRDDIRMMREELEAARSEVSRQEQEALLARNALRAQEAEGAELQQDLALQSRFLRWNQDRDGFLLLGSAPLLAVAGRAARRRDWPAAERLFRAVLKVRPRLASIWVQYAHAVKEQGDLVVALGAYRQAVKISPNDADAYIHLGHVYKRMEMTAEATQALQKAFLLSPSRVDLRQDLIELGSDPALLVDTLLAHGAPAASPGPPSAGGTLRSFIARRKARSAARRQAWEAAARHYRVALAASPTDASAWAGLGQALVESGDHLAGEGAFLQALVVDPDDHALRRRVRVAVRGVAQDVLAPANTSRDAGHNAPPAPTATGQSGSGVFSLRPLQHLRLLNGGDALTTGPDSQFALEVQDGELPTGPTQVSISIGEADPVVKPALYVWGGEDGEQLFCFALPVVSGPGCSEAVIDLPARVSAMRLDPTDVEGVRFSFTNVSFREPPAEPPRSGSGTFALTPVQHLQRLDDKTYLTTDLDPQFAMAVPGGTLPSTWTLLTVETREADPLMRPMMYVWGGESGAEISIFQLPVMVGAAVSEVLIQLPARVTAMRLDPADEAGVRFSIERVSFRDPAKEAEKLFVPLHTDSRAMEYDSWVKLYDTLQSEDREAIRRHIDRFSERPLLSVLMPVYNPAPRYLRRALDSIIEQLYPNWELCIADDASTDPRVRTILEEYSGRDPRIKVIFRTANGHISASSNSALELVSGDFVVLMDHDDELPPHSLYMVAAELNAHPEADIIYTDEDKIDGEGHRHDPHFKTDWNGDLFYAQNMVAHMGAYRTELVRRIGGFRMGFEGSQDYDFVLRILPYTAAERIRHIPFVLYHWRIFTGVRSFSTDNPSNSVNTAYRALVEHFNSTRQDVEVLPIEAFPSWWRIKRPLPATCPSVTLIIPTRNRVSLLRSCLDGILNGTRYPSLDVIVVDNESDDPETLTYLAEIVRDARVRVVRVEGDFNFSRLNNVAVAMATGEFIGFVNNDIEIIEPDWLEELVSQGLRPGIGAVGAKLLYANDTIQHAGVTLGVYGIAAHGHRHFHRDSIGYFGRPQLQQELSAVTAGLMIMPRRVFNEIGGFDEVNLTVGYNDVDLCLRIREAGYRIVYTPFAVLYHLESASRGADLTPAQQARYNRERAYMTQRWGSALAHDPFYSPNLSLSDESYRLAFPPRAPKPWLAEPAADCWSRVQQVRFDREHPVELAAARDMAGQTALVIVANAPFDVLRSLASTLRTGSFTPSRVVVVDVSPAGDRSAGVVSSGLLRSLEAVISVEVVRDEGQDCNLSRAINLGARAAADATYLTIVAEDCTFSPGWFDYLVKACCSLSGRAVVVPRVFLPDGRIEAPAALLAVSFDSNAGLGDGYDGLPAPGAEAADVVAALPVMQPTSILGTGVLHGPREALCSVDGEVFDELLYLAGREEDLALRLQGGQFPMVVTSASAVSLTQARPRDIVHLWEYMHDYAWLNRKWGGEQDSDLIEFVCPFHRGDVLIGIQVAAQAHRMGRNIRFHVAEDLLQWVLDFAPEFPVEGLPVKVPSAELTTLGLLQSYMHVVRRADTSPRIARSHPKRGLDLTGRTLVENMLESVGLPRQTRLENLRPAESRHSGDKDVLAPYGTNVILLHASGGWQLKTIPGPVLQELADEVHRHGLTLIQIGGPKDEQLAQCDGWITGNFSPATWATAFRGAKALIGVDSWSAHFASIMDVPQITLYGSTNPRQVNSKRSFVDRLQPSLTVGPVVECSPCNSLTCLRAPVDYCMGYTFDRQAIGRFLQGLSGPVGT